MDRKDLLNDIRTKNIKPVYLFHGDDEYSKRDALERLKTSLLLKGFEDLDYYSAEDISVGQVIDACSTLPFMSEKRVVVIRNMKPLLTKQREESEQPEDTKKNKDQLDPLYSYIEQPEISTCLVLYISADNSLSGTVIKALTKHGTADVLFELPKENELAAWSVRYCKNAGKIISKDAFEHLRMVAGGDYFTIKNELDKLIAFIGDRQEISIEDIEEIVSQSPEYGAFDLINKLFSGDRDGAYRTLRKMTMKGESPSALLSGLISQLRSMMFAREAIDGRQPPAHLQKQLDIRSEYAAKMYMQRARGYSLDALKELYSSAVEEERKFKSGNSTDAVSLDRLMIMIFNAERR